jgi:hypothetical protein
VETIKKKEWKCLVVNLLYGVDSMAWLFLAVTLVIRATSMNYTFGVFSLVFVKFFITAMYLHSTAILVSFNPIIFLTPSLDRATREAAFSLTSVIYLHWYVDYLACNLQCCILSTQCKLDYKLRYTSSS